MRKRTKKLTLARETLRNLTGRETRLAKGAEEVTDDCPRTVTCYSFYCETQGCTGDPNCTLGSCEPGCIEV